MAPRAERRSRLALPSRLRGLYQRVAQQLGVHPSYVSRVANGERQSHRVSKALKVEIRRSLRQPLASKASPGISAMLRHWHKQQHATATRLINTLIDTMLLFAQSASIAEPNSEAKRRCLMSAFNSHQDVRALLSRVRIPNTDARRIERRLAEAEFALHQAALDSGYVFGLQENLNGLARGCNLTLRRV